MSSIASSGSIAIVGGAFADHHLGAGAAGDLRVQRVGRLEHQRPPTRTAVGEQQRLQDLVAAVAAQEPRRRLTEERAEGGAQLGRGAVGIAIPLDVGAAPSTHRSTNAAGGAYGLSLVLSRTSTSTCGE